MKKIIIPLMAVLLSSVGCKEKIDDTALEGSISLQVAPSEEGFQIVTKANDQVEDFIVDIYRPSDRWQQSYVYGDIKGEMISLAAASYQITAHSPQTADAEWDLPIYSASKESAVKAGEVTPISLKCELTNVKVTIELSENFKRELSTYNVTVSNGKGQLTWVKEGSKDDFAAGKAGYFTVAPLEVRVTGHRAIDDSMAETSLMISDVVAKNHHVITIDAKVTGQIGGEDSDGDGNPDGISISINDSVNKVDEDVYVDGLEEIPVEGGDDSGEDEGEDDGNGDTPVDPQPQFQAPTITWLTPGNTADMSSNLTITADESDFDYNMSIHAPEGIKSFLVKVRSEKLNPLIVSTMTNEPEVEGVAVMDMIGNSTLVTNATTMGLGLPVGDQLLDVTDPVEFRLNNLLVLIPALADNGTTHVFTLDLTDNKNQNLVKDFTFVVSK